MSIILIKMDVADFIEDHPLFGWILVPFLVIILGVWFIAAMIEQGYMSLKGYYWDSHGYGYLHRKTGKRARDGKW